MPSTLVLNTLARLHGSAEKLFSARGYHGVSLREITSDAGVNLAAVNYHYGDKQSLYLEILSTRLRQVSGARTDRLAQLDSQSAGSPHLPEFGQIIDALARPLLVPDESMAGFSGASRRLVGRAICEPPPFAIPSLAMDYHPALARYGQAIRRHFPSLAPADFIWRYSFVVGALHHAAATLHEMSSLTSGLCRDDDGESALRNFRDFSMRALRSNDLAE